MEDVSTMEHLLWFAPIHLIILQRNRGRALGSDLIRLNIMGNNIIVLNSLRSAIDLLDKRSSIYSSRFVPCLCLTLL